VGLLVFNTSGGVPGTARWVRLPCTPASARLSRSSRWRLGARFVAVSCTWGQQ